MMNNYHKSSRTILHSSSDVTMHDTQATSPCNTFHFRWLLLMSRIFCKFYIIANFGKIQVLQIPSKYGNIHRPLPCLPESLSMYSNVFCSETNKRITESASAMPLRQTTGPISQTTLSIQSYSCSLG